MDNDEDFIYYGTPLPPLEENKNAPRKPDLDLTVRDWKGRRRFHGAFTGGFSAGYYNTVSTEKGWIPSQFVSSKSEKWDKNLLKSKPEDFMDDEDLSEFGIAPRKIQAKAKFKQNFNEVFAGLRDSNATIVDVVKQMIKPSTESIGVHLYRLMKRGKKYKGAISNLPKKIIGCQLPPHLASERASSFQMELSSDEDEFFQSNDNVSYTPKNNFHGIDYVPLKSELVTETKQSGEITAVFSNNKRLKISGEAFGSGALEEDDDYAVEAQIYSKDDLSNYDFAIGPSYKPKTVKPLISLSVDKNASSIEGFVKSTKIILPESQTESSLVQIPKGWRPKPPFLTAKKKISKWDQPSKEPTLESLSNVLQFSSSSSVAEKLKEKPKLNANVRSIIFGDEAERVIAIKSPKGDTIETQVIKKPSSISLSAPETSELPKPQTDPLKGYFACKFTKSSEFFEENYSGGLTLAKTFQVKEKVNEVEKKHESGVGLIKRETFQWHPHSLICKRFNVPHPYPQFPDVVGLVVVGKDVKNIIKTQTQKSSDFMSIKPNIFSSLFNASTSQNVQSLINQDSKISKTEEKKTVKEVEKEKFESDESNSPRSERPSIDLFKAIFASDESGSEDNEKINKSPEVNINEKEIKNKVELDKSLSDLKPNLNDSNKSSLSNQNLTSSKKQKAPNKGIFSGIDLDDLNQKFCYKIETQKTENTIESNPVQVSDTEDTYGPTLPPVISQTENSQLENSSTKITKTNKSRKRKHKSKKHKIKKSKKKHSHSKKSKKKRLKTSSTSSSSSYSKDDDFDLKITKLIKAHR